jgi:cytidylate kinase
VPFRRRQAPADDTTANLTVPASALVLQAVPTGVEQNRGVGSLLVITGPPGAGKSSVARILADAAPQSVLIEGDAFFGFLASDAIEPWLPAANTQNTVATQAAASAAGAFARGGYTTVYDGVVGPWFLPTFGGATGLDRIDYAILLPSVEVCVQRVATRLHHGFTDAEATRKMHAEFLGAGIEDRHVLRNPTGDAAAVAALIESARAAGELTHQVG